MMITAAIITKLHPYGALSNLIEKIQLNTIYAIERLIFLMNSKTLFVQIYQDSYMQITKFLKT